MFNKTRRTFIQGAAYFSALSLGGLSSKTIAAEALGTKVSTGDTETVNLINHTSSTVTFSSISSTGSSDIFQYLSKKVKKMKLQAGNSLVTLAPGEQRSFIVKTFSNNKNVGGIQKNLFVTDVLEDHLAIKSDYPEFNGIFPITG